MSDLRVQKAFKVLEEKEFTAVQAKNFYRNILAEKNISENDRDRLVEKLEEKMRRITPRVANQIFGPKDNEARILLEEAFSELETYFDFSQNKVGNGVKTGGHMISGQAYIDVYISYKNENQTHVALGLYQVELGSPLLCRVRRYSTLKDSLEPESVVELDAAKFDIALNEYRRLLSDICPTL